MRGVVTEGTEERGGARVSDAARGTPAPAASNGRGAGPPLASGVRSSLAAAKKEALAVAALTLAALLLRLLALRVENVLTPDGVYYAILGRHFLAGNFAAGMNHYWPPLYSLLIAFAGLFVTDLEAAGRLVSTVAGALTVVPVYLLARGTYGRRTAALAALLAALHPLLVYYSTMVLTEATYTLLFVCGVAAGWRALSAWRAPAFALTGLAFGACYLLRPEAAGFALLMLALTLGVGLFDRSKTARGALLNAAALLASFALLALPYVLYLREKLGRWTLSGKVAGHVLQGWDARFEAVVAARSASWVVQLTKALRHEYELLNLIFPTVFVLLAALGLFRAAWTRRRAARELYLFAFLLAALAGYAVSLVNIRFLVPLVPLTLGWVARGVYEGEGWLAESLGGARRAAVRLFKPLAVAALVLSLVPLFVYLMRGDKWGDYGGQKRAGRWIGARHAGRQPPPLVMATVPNAAFYAASRHTDLETFETYEQVLARVRREGVDYLVVNARELRDSPLRPLLDEAATPPELRLVFRHEDAPGLKVLVFEPARPPSP